MVLPSLFDFEHPLMYCYEWRDSVHISLARALNLALTTGQGWTFSQGEIDPTREAWEIRQDHQDHQSVWLTSPAKHQ
jgi:hypothetical protein